VPTQPQPKWKKQVLKNAVFSRVKINIIRLYQVAASEASAEAAEAKVSQSSVCCCSFANKKKDFCRILGLIYRIFCMGEPTLLLRRYDMNWRSQMQGGKNWILS
jgi:hypothetical protein